MDLQLPFFPLFFCFLLFLFMIIKRSKARKLPPGPWKLPIIGNLHHLIGSQPHHSLRDLAMKYGPLMHLQLGEITAIVVSSPNVAKEVMKTHELNFAQRPGNLAADIMTYHYKGIAFSPYGAYWRQLRKICVLELLSTKRVESFRSVREEEVSDFIESIFLTKESPINLSEKLFSLTYGMTSRAAFGKKSKDQEAYISAIKEATQSAGGFDLADLFPSLKLHKITGKRPKIEALHNKVDRILDDIVKEHATKSSSGESAAGEEDLVDVLLRLKDQGELEVPMALENIKAVINEIFSAGGETSSSTMEWAISEMLRNPRVMKKAQAEIRQVLKGKNYVNETYIQELSYLKLVIKETLRLHPPAPLLIPRECGENCEINGYEIPMKTKVFVNAWAIGRDPEFWSNADSFEPERFDGNSIDFKGNNFEYIPFGAGRRICPGMHFASCAMELVLAGLLYHFDWKLPNDLNPEHLDMTEAFGLTIRRQNDLYLIPIPSSP